MNNKVKHRTKEKIRPVIVLLFCFLLVSGCSSAQDTVYTYADGSNNTYLITKNSIEYDPVQPDESSSGTYSGGEPVKKILNPEQFLRIETMLKEAIADKEAHTDKRMMMTGQIVVTYGEKEDVIILEQDSEKKSELEKELKKLIE